MTACCGKQAKVGGSDFVQHEHDGSAEAAVELSKHVTWVSLLGQCLVDGKGLQHPFQWYGNHGPLFVVYANACWAMLHARMRDSEEERTSCFPCHDG